MVTGTLEDAGAQTRACHVQSKGLDPLQYCSSSSQACVCLRCCSVLSSQEVDVIWDRQYSVGLIFSQGILVH